MTKEKIISISNSRNLKLTASQVDALYDAIQYFIQAQNEMFPGRTWIFDVDKIGDDSVSYTAINKMTVLSR